MDNLFTNIFKNIKLDVALKEMYTYGIYVCISILIYILLPNSCIDYIFLKLSTNKTYNIIILILVISILLQFTVTRILRKIHEKHMKNKVEQQKISSILDELDTLNIDSQSILLLFYNNKTKKIKKIVKILPTEQGLDLLERMKIINFCGSVDIEGGYSIRKKQFYELTEPYYSIMNNKQFLQKKSNFVDFITKEI